MRKVWGHRLVSSSSFAGHSILTRIQSLWCAPLSLGMDTILALCFSYESDTFVECGAPNDPFQAGLRVG